MSVGGTAETAAGELRASFYSAEFFDSPYGTYDVLRAGDPVHWSGELDRWVLTRYEDVVRVLRGPEFTTRPKHRGMFRNALNYIDGQDHARIRKLINPYFTLEASKRMRDRLVKATDEVLDQAMAAPAIDFVADFANPVSIRVVTELLSMPVEDGPLLLRWTEEAMTAEGLASTPEAKLRSLETVQAMTRYVREFLDGFPSASREGHIVSDLIRAQKKRLLSEDELATTVTLLIIASLETTPSLLSSGLLVLLKNPAERDKLAGDPSLVRNALEEILRYEPPLQFINRIAREDMEIHGRKIRAGQSLLGFVGAANRDPGEFPDPHAFQIERPNAIRHVSFGGGGHHCTGAALARQVGGMVFERLLPYLPRIRSARQEEDWQREAVMLRKLQSLPVEIAPAGDGAPR
ncbi:cytochrome P450 [Sorangium sp. So ce1128]